MSDGGRPTTWTIFVCDVCGRVHTSKGPCRRWAEHESGGVCHPVEVVPASWLEQAREALREIDILASWGLWRYEVIMRGHLDEIRKLAEKALGGAAAEREEHECAGCDECDPRHLEGTHGG